MQNASAVPVYDVEVAYSSADAPLGLQKFHILSPTGSVAHYREIKCPGVGQLLAQPRADDARIDIRVTISFTDARGVRWIRDGAGHLSKDPGV
ncbi:hypothetical protein [Phycicoccus sp. Root101]|uniref:hypothetical protein n=1 Tax=Phycicoccus sp. Root101 TaxID=1736421 RepID=UPI0007024CE4|nr:hypothetical protein [Phycicoccus sp. Root101]KQU68303.1 hypothetical protein ASC58_12200 [Phycicoccus sp. Root101]